VGSTAIHGEGEPLRARRHRRLLSLNFLDDTVEVHRTPERSSDVQLGSSYAAIERHGPNDRIAALARPDHSIAVGI
jgi:hypothetical protein